MRKFIIVTMLIMASMATVGRGQDGIVYKPDHTTIDYDYYRKLAITVGQEYGIKWRVLYGVWMQESLVITLNPKIMGDKRIHKHIIIKGKKKLVTYDTVYTSFGIGQIRVKTAKQYFDPNITEQLLLNPEINSRASAAILKAYIEMFDGDEMYGVATYNMGPTKIMKYYKKKLLPKNYKSYVQKVFKYSWSAVDMIIPIRKAVTSIMPPWLKYDFPSLVKLDSLMMKGKK